LREKRDSRASRLDLRSARLPVPAGAFSSLETAREWVTKNALSGTLTAYPLDEGVFDWAVRTGALTGRARERRNEPAFIASFSSAVQEHYHFENGSGRT
jgi:hypothetical protein